MLIANQKKKENIAEYVLYMFQVETIIRSFNLEIEDVFELYICQMTSIPEAREDVKSWYVEIIEEMKEKDLKISRLQGAISKKDSVTLALVTSLKREVGIDDPDIEINVEKGVVYISLADKLLFKSGSYTITTRANEILAKVATVVNGKPDFECMVEGHTDTIPYKNGLLLDNWDLSVKRATSIVRALEGLGINPERLIASGRSQYVPLGANETAADRAKNRRTRILVLPKIDQFYDMIEKEMKALSGE